jgi:hypothetical protein
MVYLTGVVVAVRESGITVNVGESGRCNVFVRVDDNTEWPERVWSGHRVRIAADAKWRKQNDDTFSLSFIARKIEVK